MTRTPPPYPALDFGRDAASDRPRLLVSVRDSREAEEALAGGADWIDLKEPRGGALGPVDVDTARDVVRVVAGRAPVSAAAGELEDWSQASTHELLDVAGISHLKLGLAGCRDAAWQPKWHDAAAEVFATGKNLAPVIYADRHLANSPAPAEILSSIDVAHRPWMLVDTFDKRGGPLTDWLDAATLRALFAAAAAIGIQSMAAGKLRAELLSELPLDLIDMVGVRGAACRGERDAAVCRQCVQRLRESLDALYRDGFGTVRCGAANSPAQLFSGRSAFA